MTAGGAEPIPAEDGCETRRRGVLWSLQSTVHRKVQCLEKSHGESIQTQVSCCEATTLAGPTHHWEGIIYEVHGSVADLLQVSYFASLQQQRAKTVPWTKLPPSASVWSWIFIKWKEKVTLLHCSVSLGLLLHSRHTALTLQYTLTVH